MPKTILIAISACALTLSTAAFAEQNGAKRHTAAVDGNKVSVTTNTSPGSAEPRTDIAEVSTKTQRDYVANPTGVSFGGQIGMGTGNAYGLGLGAKAGYTTRNRIYLGGIIDYHFGSRQEFANNSIRNETWYFGPEVGYDLGVGPVLVRPVMGLGLGFFTGSINGPVVTAANMSPSATNETKPKVWLSPGADVIYPIGNFFVGADARYMYMRDNDGLTLFGTGGVHL